MMRFRAVLLALLLTPLVAFAQDGWRNMDGNPIAESESVKSIEGFSAMLLVTPDQDWMEKWETPREHTPHFSEAKEVGPGGELFILTFLGNPQVDPASGMTDVACDFIVQRPDGSYSIRELDMPCFKAELKGDPKGVFLTTAWLKFIAEPADPRGTWVVMVTVKDRLRAVEVPLRTSFVVR